MSECDHVRIEVWPELGGFAVRSPDLFGLNLWAASRAALRRRICEGIRLLYRLNHGVEVKVTLPPIPR